MKMRCSRVLEHDPFPRPLSGPRPTLVPATNTILRHWLHPRGDAGWRGGRTCVGQAAVAAAVAAAAAARVLCRPSPAPAPRGARDPASAGSTQAMRATVRHFGEAWGHLPLLTPPPRRRRRGNRAPSPAPFPSVRSQRAACIRPCIQASTCTLCHSKLLTFSATP